MIVDKRTLYIQITKSSIINTFIINRIVDPPDEKYKCTNTYTSIREIILTEYIVTLIESLIIICRNYIFVSKSFIHNEEHKNIINSK